MFFVSPLVTFMPCLSPSLVAIGAGRTTIRYHGRSPEMLSFKLDEPVTIFSKDDGGGGGDGLWGVEVISHVKKKQKKILRF